MKYEHGTRACYVIDRCRCWPCRQANSDYEWRRTTGRTPDRWERNLEPVRAHITALRAAGYGTRTIADIAGISRQQLQHIVGGSRGRARPGQAVRILKTVADAILAIELPATPVYDEMAIVRHLLGDHTVPLTMVERIELVRRWRAAGRSLNELERATGWSPYRYLRKLRESS